MNEETVLRICAQLQRDTYIRRQEAPEMADELVYDEVKRRLAPLGLEVHVSLHSDAYGVCYSREAALLLGGDWQHPLMRRNLSALVVVLWAKLILPHRVIAEHGPSGQQPLPGMTLQLDEAKEGKQLHVSVDQLYADFGKRFGARGTLERALSQLKTLGIVEYENKATVRAGPMLDVVLPGPLMKAYIEREMKQILVRDADFDPSTLPPTKGGAT